MTQRGFIGPLIVLALFSFFMLLLFRIIPSVQQQAQSAVPSAGQSLVADQDTKKWQQYHSQVYRMKFLYPKGFTVSEGNKRPGNENGDITISNGIVGIQIVDYIGVHGSPLLKTEDFMIGSVKAKKYVVGGVTDRSAVSGVTLEIVRSNQKLSILFFPKDDPRRALSPLELYTFDLFLTNLTFID